MQSLKNTFTETLLRALTNDKLSHAYLIETNTENDNLEIIELAKKILTYKITDNEEKEKINHLIDVGNHPDCKKIVADGNWIKKEQILRIQEEFSNKSIYGNKRIYIVEEAEKLNKSSANTLLKFLEEPNSDIIGILTTKNRYLVINTIISRCQYFNISSFGPKKIDKEDEYLRNLVNFVEMLEEKKEKSVAYYSDFNQEIFTNRAELNTFLVNILLLYNDVLYVMIKKNPIYYYDYNDRLKKIMSYNNQGSLVRKINVLTKCIEDLKYNVNIKLLLDKLNIQMSGCELNV